MESKSAAIANCLSAFLPALVVMINAFESFIFALFFDDAKTAKMLSGAFPFLRLFNNFISFKKKISFSFHLFKKNHFLSKN